jgi:ABC-type Fe3+ transport system permease subunit
MIYFFETLKSFETINPNWPKARITFYQCAYFITMQPLKVLEVVLIHAFPNPSTPYSIGAATAYARLVFSSCLAIVLVATTFKLVHTFSVSNYKNSNLKQRVLQQAYKILYYFVPAMLLFIVAVICQAISPGLSRNKTVNVEYYQHVSSLVEIIGKSLFIVVYAVYRRAFNEVKILLSMGIKSSRKSFRIKPSQKTNHGKASSDGK